MPQVREVSVYIPMYDVVFNNVSFVEVLASIPADEIQRKQQAIARIAPRLQYSAVPDRYLNAEILPRVLSNDPGHASITWQPPFRDAVDVIVDRIVDVKTMLPKQPGQMEKDERKVALSSGLRLKYGNEFSLVTRAECMEIDVFNNYMRAMHPHWNGGLTTSTGRMRKYETENTSMKEKIAGIVRGNLNSFRITPGSIVSAQEDQFRSIMYLNVTHMKLKGLDVLNSTLFAKLRHNPNIPYIAELFRNYV